MRVCISCQLYFTVIHATNTTGTVVVAQQQQHHQQMTPHGAAPSNPPPYHQAPTNYPPAPSTTNYPPAPEPTMPNAGIQYYSILTHSQLNMVKFNTNPLTPTQMQALITTFYLLNFFFRSLH